jgi:hypothetical protein
MSRIDLRVAARRVSRPIFAAMLVLASAAASAQFKCRQPGGAVSYQQLPCPVGAAQQEVQLKAARPDGAASAAPPDFKAQIVELDRPRAIREAIDAGRPAVGMTRGELDLAMGRADRTLETEAGSKPREQLSYFRNGRTFTVDVLAGVVTSVRNDPGVPAAARRPDCPGEREIRDLETELSKIAVRDKPREQARLTRRLDAARACRGTGPRS